MTWATDYGPLLTVGAILVSAIAAGTFAVLAIHNQRRIARTQLAFATFARNLWDKDFSAARREFVKLRNDDEGLVKWAAREHAASQEVASIKNILNDYETVALGMERGILDEVFCFDLFRGSLLKDFTAARPFIEEIRRREEQPQYFKKFESLAVKWGGIDPGHFNKRWHRRLLAKFN